MLHNSPYIQIKQTITTIFLILLLSSCSEEADKKDNFLVVNIDNIETVDMALSELVESCEIVSLETTEESLFNWAQGIAVSDDYIMIADAMPQPVKIFTREGQFVRNLGKIGKGPGEYNTVVSPHISKVEPCFWTLVGGNYSHPKEGWIYQFDSNGNFVGEIDCNSLTSKKGFKKVMEFMVHKDELIFPGRWDTEGLLEWKKLSKPEMFKFPRPISEKIVAYLNPTYKIYPRGDDIILKAGEADTIYKINTKDQTIIPLAAIITTDHHIDEKKMKAVRELAISERYEAGEKVAEGTYSIFLLGEAADYYLLKVDLNGEERETKLCRVNRKNGKAEFYNLNNDFLGNLPIPQTGYFYQNDYLIYNYSAIELKDHITESIKNDLVSPDWVEKLEKLNSDIAEDDNNVLIICRLSL